MEFQVIELEEDLTSFQSYEIEKQLHMLHFQNRLKVALLPDSPEPETPKQVLDVFLSDNGCFKRYSDEPPAVIVCAETNNIELLTLLFESGLDLQQRDSCAWTPLHIAVNLEHKDIVAFLLSKWASVNPSILNETTPLHLASQGTSLEIVKLLVEEGAIINCYDIDGYTPLLHACNHNRWEIARLLVEKGADVNVQGPDGKTPLLFVASAYNVSMELLSDLLTANASVHTRDDRGETPLHAILDGRKYYRLNFLSEAIEMLVTYGCDVDARTILGYTPLHKAVISEDETAVLTLIKAGCSLNIKNEPGLTPVSYAVKNNRYRLVELLLAAGASMSFSEWMNVQEVLRSKDPPMLKRLLMLRSEVPKLSIICRMDFLKRFGLEFRNRIDDLPLPASLKPFLAFKTLSL